MATNDDQPPERRTKSMKVHLRLLREDLQRRETDVPKVFKEGQPLTRTPDMDEQGRIMSQGEINRRAAQKHLIGGG